MKTNITFKAETDTYISVWRNGKQIGQIYSQTDDKQHNTPYPHEQSIYCLNAIQICGFDKISEVWGCGPFHGKKDVVVHFIPMDDEYNQKRLKFYETYVQNKINKKETANIQNFKDWSAHNI